MPRIHRRDFLAASAAFGGLGLTGLPAFAQTTPRRGGTLRVSVDQAVSKLNPLVTRVNPEYLVAELLYSGLTRLKVDMGAEPDLAESWTNSADLAEWTFVLRKGLTFHDGSPCMAPMVATFEAIRAKRLPARLSGRRGSRQGRQHLSSPVGAFRRSAR